MMGLGLRRRSVDAWRRLLFRFEPVRRLIDPVDMAGQKVCLLASFSATTGVSAHTLAWCEAWHLRGYRVVLVIATDTPWAFNHDVATTPFLAGLIVRRNIGYDFGSWVRGIRATPGIYKASLLAMANDSVYGPLDGFDQMLARVHASGADIVGMTESFERAHHLQSFLIFYKPPALQDAAFRRFWKRIPTGGRGDVIVQGELQLLSTMRTNGLVVDICFRLESTFSGNPTLGGWKRLIADGFPFVKIQLLRENPTGEDLDGWERVLTDRGYSPLRVRQHLGPRFDDSAAGLSLKRSGGTLPRPEWPARSGEPDQPVFDIE